jgi:GntR family transcriptional repressor for pyruvate dehydrogenase complex
MPKKMAEIVATELRTKILNGEFEPGESLTPEAQLVEQYDVSRPTLREALRLLEAQDLITIRRGSHRGPVVRTPDASVVARSFAMLLQLRNGNLADIYRFRMIFEPTAARLAAENANDADIAKLRATLAEEARATSDWSVFTLTSWRFHTELAHMSGNVTAALVTETLQEISRRYAEEALASSKDRKQLSERSMRAHEKLVELIAARRGEEAEKFWRTHMEVAGDVLLRKAQRLSIVEALD